MDPLGSNHRGRGGGGISVEAWIEEDEQWPKSWLFAVHEGDILPSYI